LWSQRPSLLWCSPAGVVQCTAWLRNVLETVHDVFGGYLVCGGISFNPHARPGAEGGPSSSSGLRVQGCQCTTLTPELLSLASKTARRSAISAARCATARRLSSVPRRAPSKIVMVVVAAAACFGTMFFARDQPCASEGKVLVVVVAAAAVVVVVDTKQPGATVRFEPTPKAPK